MTAPSRSPPDPSRNQTKDPHPSDCPRWFSELPEPRKSRPAAAPPLQRAHAASHQEAPEEESDRAEAPWLLQFPSASPPEAPEFPAPQTSSGSPQELPCSFPSPSAPVPSELLYPPTGAAWHTSEDCSFCAAEPSSPDKTVRSSPHPEASPQRRQPHRYPRPSPQGPAQRLHHFHTAYSDPTGPWDPSVTVPVPLPCISSCVH